MNPTVARSTEKLTMENMREEVCDFARALMDRGGSPLDLVEALISGTILFAGCIGEKAMRDYIAERDDIQHMVRESRIMDAHAENENKRDISSAPRASLTPPDVGGTQKGGST